jgi:hypothetical protein
MRWPTGMPFSCGEALHEMSSKATILGPRGGVGSGGGVADSGRALHGQGVPAYGLHHPLTTYLFRIVLCLNGDSPEFSSYPCRIYLSLRRRREPISLLLTFDRPDGIRPFDGVPIERFSRHESRYISTLNTRVLCVEVEHHIRVPVSVNILSR